MRKILYIDVTLRAYGRGFHHRTDGYGNRVLQVPQNFEPALFQELHRGAVRSTHYAPRSPSGNEREGFQAVREHLQDKNDFHANAEFQPVEACRVLPCGEAGEGESQAIGR